MKKQYINPEMKIVKVQMAQLMAGSPGYGGTTNETSGNLAPEFEFDNESEWYDWKF